MEKEKIAKEMEAFATALEGEQTELKNTLLGQAPLFKESIKAKLASSVK